MKLLISQDEYDALPGPRLVPAVCLICEQEFSRRKEIFEKSLKKYGKAGYCSRACSNKSKINHVFLPCEECGVISQKRAYDLDKNKHVFCSYRCHALFKNRNKEHGTCRSEIERYIEDMLKQKFNGLEVVCNDVTILGGQELDFYFPSLKLAVELNGITHYEPIYGVDRLSRSQESDSRKMIRCYEKGIELAVIDVSGAKYLTQKWKDTYWNEVQSILGPLCVTSEGSLKNPPSSAS